MLRLCLVRFQQAQGRAGATHGSRVRSPYEVLGVTPTTPFSVVKEKYRELARLHHPDTPTGNPHAFREVSAAYNILKAAHLSGTPPASSNATQHPSRSARNAQGAAAEEERLRQEASKPQPVYDKSWIAVRYLWGTNTFEYLVTIFAGLFIAVWTVDDMFFRKKRTGYTIHRDGLANLLAAAQLPKEKWRASTDAEMDAAFVRVASQEKDPEMREALLRGTPQVTEANESSGPSQAATARRVMTLSELLRENSRDKRFTDVKQFLYEYDIEGGDIRRVTTSRFPVRLMDETSIWKQCAVVHSFHSESTPQSSYDAAVDGVVAGLEQVAWHNADNETAGILMANALAVVPVMSPSNAKWTLVEYKALDEDGGSFKRSLGHVGTTECLFALLNKKFVEDKKSSKTSAAEVPAQRVVVTGAESLASREARLRHAQAIESKSKIVKGGVVVMHDRPSFRQPGA